MYALPERCPFSGLFIQNPIYSTTPAGITNHVPLSRCDGDIISTKKGIPELRVSFTNGITRTIWFLANGAFLHVLFSSSEFAYLLQEESGDT
ncbi:plasmid fertility inhibition factor family protein [Serratia symbiotica]|uniref:plasmid fertility inhibition factor family protein n=1 Tax=Serratia symbiotica TaxID=138074 RepID=UPI0030D374CC